MATVSSIFLFLIHLICFANGSDHTKFKSEYDPVSIDILSKTNFNTSNIVNEVLLGDWTGNVDCLVELNAIKNGLKHFDEWALRIIDAWGKLPSGILSGNSFEPGSFSQCFHIERNGADYKTQYCIGTLMFQPRKTSERNKVFTRVFDGPDISIGLCLPAACSPDQLEHVINAVFYKNGGDMNVQIPQNTCQTEEFATELTTLDWAAIILLGTVFGLMILSTIYDVFCELLNCSKYQAFLVFSAYTNGKKLFPYENAKIPNAITCMDGLRALSIMWVVLIHSSWKNIGLPLQSKIEYSAFLSSYGIAVPYATIVVDSYWTMSGILASNKMLKLLRKEGKLDLKSLYLRRYLRLTPLLGVTILVTMSSLRFFGSGPMWPILITFLSSRCDKYWWSALLHIQNYANDYGTCLSQSWYLSIEMQLFIVAPFLVYAYHRYRTKTIIVSLLSILICMGWTWAIYVKYDLTKIYQKNLQLVYVPTHIRFPPWLLGFLTGCLFVEYPVGSVRIPKLLNLCGWTLSFGMILGVIFGNYPYLHSATETNAWDYGLYSTLTHVAWGIAFCYIIFACANNAGGPINWFLSHPFWMPISKLSYAIYMVHFPVIMITTGVMRTPFAVSQIGMLQQFFGDFILSFLVAIPATLAFEMPIDAIDRLLFSSQKKELKIKNNEDQYKYKSN